MRSVPCDEVHPRITLVEPSASDGLGQPVSVEVDCGSLATSEGTVLRGRELNDGGNGVVQHLPGGTPWVSRQPMAQEV